MKTWRASPVLDLPDDPSLADDDTVVIDNEHGAKVVSRRRIGELLAEMLGLSPEQMQEIAAGARQRNLRFGEAAIQLGHASPEAVLAALARQFDYPCMPGADTGVLTELVMLSRPMSPQAEAVRAIRSQVLRRVFRAHGGGHALAVVSPDSGDGKTFLVANLAVALAQTGARTVVLDADLRHPRLHEVFGVDNTAGLSSLMLDGAYPAAVQAVSGVPGLYLLPAGTTPPNPLELMERAAFAHVLAQLVARFDHVVVDTPAAIFGTDAQVIAERCGAAVLVARRDASRVARLQALVEALSDPPEALVGLVLNDF